MHKLSFASFADLGWAELGCGHPKPPRSQMVWKLLIYVMAQEGLMHKLGLASLGELGLAGLGGGNPKAPVFTNGVEVDDYVMA